MESESLYSAPYDAEILREVKDPMDCIIRFKEIVLPRGYIDAENLKKTICQFIDDSGFINF